MSSPYLLLILTNSLWFIIAVALVRARNRPPSTAPDWHETDESGPMLEWLHQLRGDQDQAREELASVFSPDHRGSRPGRKVVTATVLGGLLVAAGVGVSAVGGTGPHPSSAGRLATITKPSQRSATRVLSAKTSPSVRAILLRPGDTLWALARRYGTSIAALQALNGLGTSTMIYAGHTLRVSAAAAHTTRQSTPASVGLTPSRSAGVSGTGKPSSGPRGIYAFSGGDTSDLASDPDVAGRSLVYYWAQLEPKPGVYRWNLIDKDIAPWAAAGKKVILRVSVAGWASWDRDADSAHGTPAWVYAQGVKSVTEKDGAVLPQYWNPLFQRDLSEFLHAFGARYDGNPHVALIDAAVGIGGETKVDSEKNPDLLSLWQSIGYTDKIWWSTVQRTLAAYTDSFRKTPVAVMPDKTFIGGTPGYNERKLLVYAVSKGLWLQDNGLVPNRTLPAPWGQTPIVSEQRGPTSQTGDSLAADLQAALADHARIILVFTSDITPANSAVIHQAAVALRSDPGAPAPGAPRG